DWTAMVQRLYHPERTVRVALVGKYTELHDAYLSVVESLLHAGTAHSTAVDIDWIDASTLTDDTVTAARLAGIQGIVVPGGFGDRGIEGMIRAAHFARTAGVPYLGLCLGMQILVIEFARHVLGLPQAHSTEMDRDTPDPVIALMPDQNGVVLGGTLRLGKFRCALTPGTLAHRAYDGAAEIGERHRHRYEFMNSYRPAFEAAGACFSGVNPERDLVEITEITGHPWMLGVQFHPEFKSRPNRPQPLFREFIGAVCEGYSDVSLRRNS
ncbi:MAG: CTP synthase, partial [Spirochaetaceae bacterium]|nr:CTP synthase [Spirochaetaceae bacterium]